MNIRGKLSITFILLLVFGVTAVSSYSIMFIRAFLLDEGLRQMEEDGHWMKQTIRNLPHGHDFEERFSQVSRSVRYDLVLFDENGSLLATSDGADHGAVGILPEALIAELMRDDNHVLVFNEKDDDLIYTYAWMPESFNEARFLQISQYKDEIFEPIATIRWIIYTGMFISMGLILIVSTLFSRYLSRPIITLSKAAKRIADGDVKTNINLKRSDEFGTLSDSINQMATRLRDDNEQLQKINEKQRQFLADIAHEVRNPLHTIMGSLEMLGMDKPDAEKKKKYLRNAAAQTERLSHLFRDLMTLQRYDSDEHFIRKKVFDLSEITQKMDDWYREKADEKNVSLTVDKHPVKVYGDPGKIEQVLDNLISNALKFTSKGRVELTCEQENGSVLVKVVDTGSGIPEEHLENLFDRFYRMDKARSRDQGGTGLGLAIVKSILEAHGEPLYIESKEGEGSAFSFRIQNPEF